MQRIEKLSGKTLIIAVTEDPDLVRADVGHDQGRLEVQARENDDLGHEEDREIPSRVHG